MRTSQRGTSWESGDCAYMGKRLRVLEERAFPLGEERIEELTSQFGTPLLILLRERIVRNYRAFQRFLPGVEVFYAVKANPHPSVVGLLASLGSSFDVASQQEIALVMSFGVAPERMIFANTVKRREGILYARKVGVSLMTYDNEEELKKIQRYYPEAKLVLRLKTPSNGSRIDLSYKFGAEPEEALELLLRAQDMGLAPVGLSFHVGSPCHNPKTYATALHIVEEVLLKAQARGLFLTLIDIGGGFPLSTYSSEGGPASLEIVSEVVYPLLEPFLSRGFRVIAEPGRSIVGNAGILVTRVIGKAVRSGRIWYYLDDGLYGTFSAIPFDKARFSFYALKESDQEVLCTLAGPTCDSLDVVAEDVVLPPLEVDDLVVVPDIGAYSWASATTFNGFDKPQVVMV
jgi:ornithine decarboxylase|uniref:ornithine decarboxylase n=1 Tax=Candidatus Caldatribacterium californiense TaxID=1454726 RepID=A0A7V3YHR0_9BACT